MLNNIFQNKFLLKLKNLKMDKVNFIIFRDILSSNLDEINFLNDK